MGSRFGCSTRGLALAVALHGLAQPAVAQIEDSSRITTVPVADGIYLLMGDGGNIGVSIGKDGTFLIDDELAPLTDRVKAAIDSIGGGAVRFVLNTHWHGDHTGGNEKLGQAGAVIVAHEHVRKRMSVEQFLEAFNRRVPASPEIALPVVTFDDAVTFHLNGDEIRVVHVPPAHTDGDAVVRFTKANVVHLGDVYFNGSYPFIDLASGGAIDGVIGAVERVLPELTADTKIIPGHGLLSNREELQAYRAMLVTLRGRIAGLVKAGRTLAQVQAAKPSAEFDAKWGHGFLTPDQFVGIVYQDLSRPPGRR